MKSDDDIMAECLLNGGKMLSVACPQCGSPLFEIRGERFCAVCRAKENSGVKAVKAEEPPVAEIGEAGAVPVIPGSVEEGLQKVILVLCGRLEEEKNPKSCRVLADCIESCTRSLLLFRER